MNASWWALFLVALAGVVLAAGSLTRHARIATAVALGLFTAAVVLMLVTAVG